MREVGGRGWAEFEVVNAQGETVLLADIWTAERARTEFRALEAFLRISTARTMPVSACVRTSRIRPPSSACRC